MNIWSLLKQTGVAWNDHEAQRMGASLAYYSVLSMAPLAIIAIAIAGYLFGRAAAEGQIVYQVQNTVGEAGAEVLQNLLKNARQPSSGIIATVVGVATLLFSSSGVFIELRSSLNLIWGVPKDKQGAGLTGTVRYYVFSFAMVLTIGFLLLVSLVVSTVMELFEHWLTGRVPAPPLLIQGFNLVLSFVVISLLFGLIYKFVPDTRVQWTDVMHGAVATALLFTLGKYLLALYIAKMSVGSAYGAAGSLVVMLVWVYYSAQIFFFGAEFTHIYALTRKAADTRPASQLSVARARPVSPAS